MFSRFGIFSSDQRFDKKKIAFFFQLHFYTGLVMRSKVKGKNCLLQKKVIYTPLKAKIQSFFCGFCTHAPGAHFQKGGNIRAIWGQRVISKQGNSLAKTYFSSQIWQIQPKQTFFLKVGEIRKKLSNIYIVDIIVTMLFQMI